MKNDEFISPFAKRHIQLGRDEGIALSLLTVLRVRGINVPQGTRELIVAEKEAARVEHWLERAATARTLADVLAEPS